MNAIHQTADSLRRALKTFRALVLRLLPFQGHAVAAAWTPPQTGTPAPSCLSRAMQGGKNLQVNPATEERILSALTMREAEEMLDWIEANGYRVLETGVEEQTGFFVRWDVR